MRTALEETTSQNEHADHCTKQKRFDQKVEAQDVSSRFVRHQHVQRNHFNMFICLDQVMFSSHMRVARSSKVIYIFFELRLNFLFTGKENFTLMI
jgi:hypothetical protein